MKTIKLYVTQFCPFCHRAKVLLQSKNIPFEETDLTDNDSLREELQNKTGHMTVPMIFIGEEFIGGAQELQELEDSGALDQKLTAP